MSDPVDLTNLREMTDGDADMEQMLFNEYYHSTESGITTLSNNCVDGENENWRGSAHALKGTSLNLGAERLGALCKQAQEGHGASAAEKRQMLDAIREEYEKVKAYLLKVH